MSSLLEDIRKLTEPTVRAIRRGDSAQLMKLSAELDSRFSFDGETYEDGVASGYWQALAGAVEIAADRAQIDRRIHFVQSRKRAIPILHALGLQRWTALQSGNAVDSALIITQLAKITGVIAQNVGGLIRDLEAQDLVTSHSYRQSRRVAITDMGIDVLTLVKPHWHTDKVERANEPDWDVAFERFLKLARGDQVVSTETRALARSPVSSASGREYAGQSRPVVTPLNNAPRESTSVRQFPGKVLTSKTSGNTQEMGKSYSRMLGVV